MAPQPRVLLSLALCLGQLSPTRGNGCSGASSSLLTVTQDMHLLPSISALPGLKIPRGQTVTFVCRGPAEVNTFRLEKQRNICSHMDRTRERHDHTDGRCEGSQCVNSSCVQYNYEDKTVVPQPGPGETEAQFPIEAVSGDFAGCYRCLYRIDSQWSERSETLELMVTPEDVSDRPPGSHSLTQSSPAPSTALSSEEKSPVLLYIIPGAVAAFLLLLLLLLLLLYRRRKRGTLGGKGKEGRRQESSILEGLPEKTPDLVAVDSSQMPDRDQTLLTTASGDPQEVTYAQLDHRTLTQRTPGAAPSQATDPTAESCTYASLARS